MDSKLNLAFLTGFGSIAAQYWGIWLDNAPLGFYLDLMLCYLLASMYWRLKHDQETERRRTHRTAAVESIHV